MKFMLIFLALLAASPARAAPADMSTRTCQDWLDAEDDEQDQMVAWLHGYLAGRSTGTIYDMGSARADAAQLKLFCQSNKTVGIISAAGQWKH